VKVLVVLIAFGVSAGIPAAAQDANAKIQALEQKLAAQHHLLIDWPGLNRYGSEDAEVKPPRPGEDRVVFLGDDITEHWSAFFPGKPYLNRGISGQTSPQMLVRFRQDVIALQPKVVVIQAGTNDLAAVIGPMTQGTMADNFQSMTELAKAHGIRVILASITPVCDCYQKQTLLRPQGKIIGMNGWIKDYAAESGSVYLDYYSALAEGRNFRKELTDDGWLPNAAGYAVMAPVAERAIAQALGKKGVQ
jgi:lysophospholipase L1-like esterase